jgi:hypothetical protein
MCLRGLGEATGITTISFLHGGKGSGAHKSKKTAAKSVRKDREGKRFVVRADEKLTVAAERPEDCRAPEINLDKLLPLLVEPPELRHPTFQLTPNKGLNMKTRGLISVTLFLVALSLLTEAVADNGYSARLISPAAGQVLYAGQTVRVEWQARLPHTDAVGCEMELVLSLDGGTTFNTYITPPLDPKARYFYWTVPNTPTNAAMLDIRFGCEVFYPESRSPQTASPFVIKQSN